MITDKLEFEDRMPIINELAIRIVIGVYIKNANKVQIIKKSVHINLAVKIIHSISFA